MDLSKYLNKLKIRDRIFLLYVTPGSDHHPVGLPNTQYNLSLPDIKQQTKNKKNSPTPIFHYIKGDGSIIGNALNFIHLHILPD